MVVHISSMKVCFFLQRRFATIGHAMAQHLKEDFPDAEFCGIVQMRKSFEFLQEQKDIHYTSLILEEDMHNALGKEKLDLEYLRSLEKEYGIPNLWPYLYIDRIIMRGQLRREYPYDHPLLSREDMLKRLQATARGVIAFLDREKPDVLVISVAGSVASLLLWHIAKKRGIPTLISQATRVGNRMVWTEDFHSLTFVRKRFEEMQKGLPAQESAAKEAETFLREFRGKPFTYYENLAPTHNLQAYRSGNIRFLAPTRLVRSIWWHTRTLIAQLTERRERDYTDTLIWWQTWDKLKRKIRGVRGYEKFYSLPKKGERYAFFALQQEPEVSILLYTPYHTDQLDFIRASARALPIDMMLYVKEHPEMVGRRTRTYYEEITKIPNVRLLDPRIESFGIVQGSSLVLTIAGTVGWEASLFGKPVITFGKAPYSDLPFIVQCGDFNELPHLVQKQLQDFKYDERALLDYLTAIMEDSASVDYYKLWESAAPLETMRTDEGMRSFSTLLGKKIRSLTGKPRQ